MSIADTPAGVRPTHLDLPHTDDEPVESTYQSCQCNLLTGSLVPHLDRLYPDGSYYVGAGVGIYWRMTEPAEDGCRAPDWFCVANVPRLLGGEIRKSYVMWREVVSPLLVVEVVSGDGSGERDETPFAGKWWVYEHAIRAAYYAIWDPERARLDVYELVRLRYQPVPPTAAGRFPIPAMEVELGVWEGEYQNYPAHWLRAWDRIGRLVPTPEESTTQEKQRADHERQRADHERQRAEKLAAKLRELGVDPDAL